MILTIRRSYPVTCGHRRVATRDAGFARLETRLERRVGDLIKWSFVFWVGAVGAIAMLARVLR